MHYLYVLVSKTSERQSYIGITADTQRRLEQHNSGLNTSTRGRQWRLVYYEAYSSKRAAEKRERMLKNNGRSRQLLMRRVWESLEENDAKIGDVI